jgi:hypothetical protein
MGHEVAAQQRGAAGADGLEWCQAAPLGHVGRGEHTVRGGTWADSRWGSTTKSEGEAGVTRCYNLVL